MGDERKRRENERKFSAWVELCDDGRRYFYEVQGRHGWIARYVKQVDASERTVRFYQEIHDDTGRLVEIYEKYVVDKGHRAVQERQVVKITRRKVAQKLIDYLDHRITLAELVSWAELAMMEADFDARDFETLRDIVSRLGLADVRAFGMTWEDCEDFLSRLGYRVNITVLETPMMA